MYVTTYTQPRHLSKSRAHGAVAFFIVPTWFYFPEISERKPDCLLNKVRSNPKPSERYVLRISKQLSAIFRSNPKSFQKPNFFRTDIYLYVDLNLKKIKDCWRYYIKMAWNHVARILFYHKKSVD